MWECKDIGDAAAVHVVGAGAGKEPVSAAIALDKVVATGPKKEVVLIAAKYRIIALHGIDEDGRVVRAR